MTAMEKKQYELKRTLPNGTELIESLDLFGVDVKNGVVTGYNHGIVFSYGPGQWDSIRVVDSITAMEIDAR